MSLDELLSDRKFAKEIKKAKRRAERQQQNARMEEDDLTQDLVSVATRVHSLHDRAILGGASDTGVPMLQTQGGYSEDV